MYASEYYAMDRHEQDHWWYKILHRQTCESIRQYFPKEHSFRLLDAGCGTGGFLKLVSQKFPDAKMNAFDKSEIALNLAKQKTQHLALQASIDAIPFKSNHYDVVVCHDVLYLKNVDIAKAMSEFRRVLKKGGYLILNLAAFSALHSVHDEKVYTHKRFSKKDLDKILEKNVWTVCKKFYWNSFLLPPVMLIRWIKGLGLLKGSDVDMTNRLFNKILYQLLVFERFLLNRFPFVPGLSLYCAARKKE